jgi:outer membrane protein TolC
MKRIASTLATGVLATVMMVAWAEDDASPDTRSVGRSTVLDGAGDILEAVAGMEEYLAKQQDEEEARTQDGARVLTARQCVELAFAQNAKVLVADANIDAARARVGQSRSQWFPQIKVATAFTHTEMNTPETNKYMDAFGTLSGGDMGISLQNLTRTGGGILDGGAFDSRAALSTINLTGAALLYNIASAELFPTPEIYPDDDLRTDSFTVDQVIYAGGQIRAATKAAKYLAESEEWQKKVTLAQLEYEAKQAFYDALLANALVRVAEGSVRTFERTRRDAQHLFEAGMINNFEVLRAQTELNARKADLVSARNGGRLAKANLCRILGLPQNTPLRIDPDLDWLPFTPDLGELVARAMQSRPEIQAMAKGIDAARQDVRRVRGQYLPRIGANAQYTATHAGGPTIPDGWQVSVAGEIDLFAGGRRRYDTKEAQARLRSYEHQLVDLERLVELDVNQAHIQIQDAMAKIQSEQSTVELAREGMRLAELRFKENVGTQAETLDAELAQTGAETNLVQALRNYAVAHAALDRATGRSWLKSDDAATETGAE